MKKFAIAMSALFALSAGACDKKAEGADAAAPAAPAPAAPEAPKAEEPKAEAPKAEEPKAEEPKAEEPKAEAGALPAVCQKYIDTMKACIAKAGPAGAAAQSGLDTATSTWTKAIQDGGDAAKAAIETGCQQAFDAAKGGMGALCPDVSWE